MVLSVIPLNIAVRRAKFFEEWAKTKTGINNISNNSLLLHDLYGNQDSLRSNQTTHILHLFNVPGMWIGEYDSQLRLTSNPAYNSFSRFNPFVYKEVFEAITSKNDGEFKLKFSPDDKSTRYVYLYFRWTHHVHLRTGEECHYLMIVASSVEALETIIEPSVVLVFMTALVVIVSLFAVSAFLNYSYDMNKLRDFGRGIKK